MKENLKSDESEKEKEAAAGEKTKKKTGKKKIEREPNKWKNHGVTRTFFGLKYQNHTIQIGGGKYNGYPARIEDRAADVPKRKTKCRSRTRRGRIYRRSISRRAKSDR